MQYSPQQECGMALTTFVFLGTFSPAKIKPSRENYTKA